MSNRTGLELEICEINENSKYSQEINEWSCGLWYSDFDEAGIKVCYVAFIGDFPIGWQTTNIDNFCVAIEVHPDYQGLGVASALIEESGAWRPEQNGFREFWDKMKAEFGY